MSIHLQHYRQLVEDVVAPERAAEAAKLARATARKAWDRILLEVQGHTLAWSVADGAVVAWGSVPAYGALAWITSLMEGKAERAWIDGQAVLTTELEGYRFALPVDVTESADDRYT